MSEAPHRTSDGTAAMSHTTMLYDPAVAHSLSVVVPGSHTSSYVAVSAGMEVGSVSMTGSHTHGVPCFPSSPAITLPAPIPSVPVTNADLASSLDAAATCTGLRPQVSASRPLRLRRCVACGHAFASDEAYEAHSNAAQGCQGRKIPRSLKRRAMTRHFPNSLYTALMEPGGDETADAEDAGEYDVEHDGDVVAAASPAAANSYYAPPLSNSSAAALPSAPGLPGSASSVGAGAGLAGAGSAIAPHSAAAAVAAAAAASAGVPSVNLPGRAGLTLGHIATAKRARLTAAHDAAVAASLAEVALAAITATGDAAPTPASASVAGPGKRTAAAAATAAVIAHVADGTATAADHLSIPSAAAPSAAAMGPAAALVAAASAALAQARASHTAARTAAAAAESAAASVPAVGPAAARLPGYVAAAGAPPLASALAAAVPAGGAGGGDDDDELSEEEAALTQDPFSVPAAKAIHMRLVSSDADIASSKTAFSPTYTHQLFENEYISGFRGISIDLYFAAGSLDAFFQVRFREPRNSYLCPSGLVGYEAVMQQPLLSATPSFAGGAASPLPPMSPVAAVAVSTTVSAAAAAAAVGGRGLLSTPGGLITVAPTPLAGGTGNSAGAATTASPALASASTSANGAVAGTCAPPASAATSAAAAGAAAAGAVSAPGSARAPSRHSSRIELAAKDAAAAAAATAAASATGATSAGADGSASGAVASGVGASAGAAPLEGAAVLSEHGVVIVSPVATVAGQLRATVAAVTTPGLGIMDVPRLPGELEAGAVSVAAAAAAASAAVAAATAVADAAAAASSFAAAGSVSLLPPSGSPAPELLQAPFVAPPALVRDITAEEVLDRFRAKFPHSAIVETMAEFKVKVADSIATFTPPGTVIHSYTVPSVDQMHKGYRVEYSYHVFHGRFSDPAMKAFHERLQFFLLSFIDRSSFIDADDLIWEVLVTFEKAYNRGTQETTWRVVGYTTLYTFLNYPQGERLRLSQIIIFPPFQRQGHGQQLLNSVMAEAERRDAIEVNIEDPAIGFQALRDLTDVTRARERGFFLTPEPWNAVYAETARRALRVTLGQVRRVHDICRLAVIDARNEAEYKAFRLDVKRRLLKRHEEELSVYTDDPEARKAALHEKYLKLESAYRDVLRKVRLR